MPPQEIRGREKKTGLNSCPTQIGFTAPPLPPSATANARRHCKTLPGFPRRRRSSLHLACRRPQPPVRPPLDAPTPAAHAKDPAATRPTPLCELAPLPQPATSRSSSSPPNGFFPCTATDEFFKR